MRNSHGCYTTGYLANPRSLYFTLILFIYFMNMIKTPISIWQLTVLSPIGHIIIVLAQCQNDHPRVMSTQQYAINLYWRIVQMWPPYVRK